MAGEAFDGADMWEGIARLLARTPGGRVRVTTIDVWGDHDVDARDGAAATLPVGTALGPKGPITVRWNVQGHAVIAMLAADVLSEENPPAFAALQKLMNADPLERGKVDDGTPPVGAYAQWPDRIKGPSRSDPDNIRDFGSLGQQHKIDHYVNFAYEHRSGSKSMPAQPIGDGRLLEALETWQQQLAKEKDPQARCTALAFILHLVGDIHQPLHCTALIDDRWFPGDDGDQGGNLIWWGANQSLHAYWDNLLARKSDDVEKSFELLRTGLDRAAFKDELKLKTFAEWAAESFEIAVASVYDPFLAGSKYLGSATRVDHRNGSEKQGQLFEQPKREYQDQAREIARRRAQLATFRLADILAQVLQ